MAGARSNTRCERCRRTPAPVRAAAVAPKSPGGPDSGGSVASRGCRGQGNQNRSWQCRSAPSRSQEDLLPRPVPPHRHRRRGPPRTSQGPLACAAAARLVLPVPVCPLSPVQASQRVVHRACLHRSAGATLATVTPRGLRSHRTAHGARTGDGCPCAARQAVAAGRCSARCAGRDRRSIWPREMIKRPALAARAVRLAAKLKAAIEQTEQVSRLGRDFLDEAHRAMDGRPLDRRRLRRATQALAIREVSLRIAAWMPSSR